MTELQSKLNQVEAAGIAGCESHDGNIYNSEGDIINVDSLGVISASTDTGLAWWNSGTKVWLIVDPLNPETYPPIYLEHWNSLATRTPVSQPTNEDLVFNNFQIASYRDFFLWIQPTLEEDTLWQAFFSDQRV